MPSAPMMTLPPAAKPKIGFSIDSIVGNRLKSKSPTHYSQDSEGSDTPLSPLSDFSYQQRSPRLPNDIHRALNEYSQMELQNRLKRSLESSPPPQMQGHDFTQKNLSSPSENSVHSVIQHNQRQHGTPSPPQTRLSVDETSNRTPSPLSPSTHQQQPAKKPILVPGIPAGLIRPSPVQPPPPPQLSDLRVNLPAYPADMISAAQNHFFRLGIFKQLLP